MIATLRGEISQIEDASVVIQVGGMGIRVYIPAPLLESMTVGDGAFLYTHLVVRENAWSLYGFEFQADRDLFNLLSLWQIMAPEKHGPGRRGSQE